jgi:two-component system, OmpR family, phosphate regulon response regulator PhoB
VSSDEKPRILVVDDDAALQRLVSTLLNRANMMPLSATTAGEAAQILKQDPLPQIVILDMMLPDVSGIEFLKQMRSKERFDYLPIIILSALADPDRIREGLTIGADRYLTKPYLANNLISTVQELLRKGRSDKN